MFEGNGIFLEDMTQTEIMQVLADTMADEKKWSKFRTLFGVRFLGESNDSR